MENINKDLLLTRIEKLCNERNINQTTAFKESGVGKNFKSNLSTSNPSMGKITMLANYFGVPVDYLTGESDETEQYPQIKANLSELFDQNNSLTRYTCHLWEALNEIITSHLLFEYILNQSNTGRSSDWFLVFKQCVSAICESAKLLAIEETDKDILKFTNSRDHYLNVPEIKSNYCRFEEKWEKHKSFFRNFRNHFMHFDHERIPVFSDYISKTKEHTFYDYNGDLCDFNETIAEDIMYEMYKIAYKTDKTDRKVLKVKCFENLSDMLIETISVLQEIMGYFFKNYADKTQEILTLNKFTPYIEYNNTASEEKKASEKKDTITFPTANALSKDESKILITYKTLTEEGKKKAADYIDDLATNPKYKSDEKIKLYPEAAFNRSRTVEEGPYTEKQLQDIKDPKNKAELDKF